MEQCCNHVLNQREYNLLLFLLQETEPGDPFAERPSRQIKFTELREVPFIKAAYKDVTVRTFLRELIRLAEIGFISFKRDETPDGPVVEVDFGAIGKY